MGEIYDFYDNGAEIGRLQHGLGSVECYRTKELLFRYIPMGRDNPRDEKWTIYDVGGGIGVYARFLASYGHEVHLLELAENAVEYAKEHLLGRILSRFGRKQPTRGVCPAPTTVRTRCC